MVNKRSRSSRSKNKAGKVRKARAVVMVLLVLVALTIVLIDKKDEGNAVDMAQHEPQATSETSAATTNSVYNIAVPSQSSIAQNVDTSNLNPVKNLGTPRVIDTVRSISTPTVSKSVTNPIMVNRPSVHNTHTTLSENSRKEFPTFHKVAHGETLSHIASKYYGSSKSWKNLYRANRDVLRSPRSLRVGQKLRLPSPSNRAKRRAGVSRNRLSGKFVATSSGKATLASNGQYHVVSRGETLSGIAKRQRVSFLRLYDVNKKTLRHNPNYLREGMKLRIPK